MLAVVGMTVAFGAAPEEIRAVLEAANIESRPVWKPMHLQRVFRDAPHVGGGVAESLFARGLCLPSGSGMTDAQQDRVIEAIVLLHRRVRGG